MKYSVNFESTQLPPKLRAERIREAGFDAVFPLWLADDAARFDTIDLIRSAGLAVESVHTGFHGINAMWEDTIDGADYCQYFLRAVDEVSSCGVPTLIIHLSSGDTPPAYNALGLERYRRIVSRAAEKGVVMAFENLRLTSYLDAILRDIPSPAAGFCFDCGHENLYNGGRGVLEAHADRLCAFHLHDNLGRAKGDLHLLPFDGTIDWETLANRIAPYAKRLPLTAETYATLENKKRYEEETFYPLVLSKLKKLGDLVK